MRAVWARSGGAAWRQPAVEYVITRPSYWPTRRTLPSGENATERESLSVGSFATSRPVRESRISAP